MHAHTAETSRCANVRAKMAVAAFIRAGYDGAVITDHFSPSTFEGLDLSWDEMVTHFLKGYRAALKAADGRIHILLGMELRFAIPNDMYFDSEIKTNRQLLAALKSGRAELKATE